MMHLIKDISKASIFYEEEYNKGFKEGENYSLEYGKLLGIIDCIKFFDDNNVFQIDKMPIEAKTQLNDIEKELEEFKDKLNNEIILSFKQRLESILNIILNK